MRWIVKYFDMNNIEDGTSEIVTGEYYGFKSGRTPPSNKFLRGFEDRLYAIVRSIEFKSTKNAFQQQLKRDVREIVKSDKVYVFADKTTNLYEVGKGTYKKVLVDNITEVYRKSDKNLAENINIEAKRIAKELNMGNRIDSYAKRNSYITFKDHKDNFENKLQCRLINPAKSEMGKISKRILQQHNDIVRKEIGVEQWHETQSVIEWFKRIPNKTKCRFLKFDIDKFYPSITESTLLESIEFAKKFTAIEPREVDIILHARKCLLFNQEETWVKQDENLFDVTMGSYDSSEIADLVGLFLLSELEKRFGKGNIGIYRDDGLCILPFTSGPKAERSRKDLIDIFKRKDFNITASTTLVITDFLDVTLNLTESKYYLFRKDNNTILYIDAKSNHPPSIIKELPSMVNKRLSALSCNEEEFKKAGPVYKQALKSSVFSEDLKYNENPQKRRKRRSRKITYFNPPFNSNVKTNIGREFLRLVREQFPPTHKYRKIFNKNTLKISYSCMENVEEIIKSRNAKILKDGKARPKQCNSPTLLSIKWTLQGYKPSLQGGSEKQKDDQSLLRNLRNIFQKATRKSQVVI